jgi:DNA-binding IclR family transcriptional regulator
MNVDLKNGVQAVGRALRLIERLADDPSGRRLADLAVESELAPSTTHRALQTLAKAGFVSQDPGTGLYRLTGKLLEIASRGVGGRSLRDEAAPCLQRLRELTGESSHLAVREGNSVLTIEVVLSEERNMVTSCVGEREALYCTAVGKVLLAFMPEEQLENSILNLEMPRLTDNTICTAAALRNDMTLVRKRGYALDWEENETGIRCIAAPVRDMTGDVIASVGITGPAIRITDDKLGELAAHVMRIAGELSTAIGYSGMDMPYTSPPPAPGERARGTGRRRSKTTRVG